jgi:ABC-type multidrug transport system fused ATPase/permease subunit
VYSAVTLFFFILFSGYIIPIATIPPYYMAFYALNPFAWAYNALIVNEVYSGREENPEAILKANGVVRPNGEVFDESWIKWSILYMTFYWFLCTVGTALGLSYWRATTRGSSSPKTSESLDVNRSEELENKIEIPFKPVTLSFQDICYEVTASTSKEKMMLLKNVSGVFHPGRMCALMGASGAGYVDCGPRQSCIATPAFLNFDFLDTLQQNDSDGKSHSLCSYGYSSLI